ncbi:MAG: PilZ domain-containing protein [Acidobacteria bacterium]|nr:PilZ domain-containing protein [Acidobacteriota bacterium]
MDQRKDRRRTPRIDIGENEVVRLELRHQVQLLDISQSGALIGCETGLPVGTRGHIRAGLDAEPFSAEVVVQRHHVRSAVKGQVGLGTVFGTMDDRSQRTLEGFLQRAKD